MSDAPVRRIVSRELRQLQRRRDRAASTPTACIRWANPATADVLGYAPDDIVGVHVRDLVEPVDREAWQALVGKLFDDPGDAGARRVPLPAQGRHGALDRGRGPQPAAGAARRRHRRLLPRRHRAEGDRSSS